MKKGAFIAIEGGEGTGKTTQINKLKEYLPGTYPDREFVFTHEPGGSPFAQEIRKLILGDSAKEANARTMFGLFMAARADHVAQTILPALKKGAIIICDRYLGSTYAYQIVAQEDRGLEAFFWEHTKLVPNPDLTLFFDIDPQAALDRIKDRGTTATHFDLRVLSFHENVRSGLAEYFEKSHSSIAKIDASKSVEEVWEEVKRAVESAL